MHHARIRLGCSKLNSHLSENLHVIDNPKCSCDYRKEDAHHYFFRCPHYNDIRIDLYSAISVYSEITLSIILHGNPHLSIEQNKFIFDAVHSYIIRSDRFK